MNRAALASITAIGVLLILTIALVLFVDQPFQRRLLWFPDTAGGAEHAEWHYIPNEAGANDAVRAVVREIMLGPVQLGAVPYVTPATRIRSLVVSKDRDLFIDFSREIIFNDRGREAAVVDILALLERTLRQNFRWLERVVITINGQVPNTPSFGADGR